LRWHGFLWKHPPPRPQDDIDFFVCRRFCSDPYQFCSDCSQVLFVFLFLFGFPSGFLRVLFVFLFLFGLCSGFVRVFRFCLGFVRVWFVFSVFVSELFRIWLLPTSQQSCVTVLGGIPAHTTDRSYTYRSMHLYIYFRDDETDKLPFLYRHAKAHAKVEQLVTLIARPLRDGSQSELSAIAVLACVASPFRHIQRTSCPSNKPSNLAAD
jgi:hypothetical protein